MEHWQHGDTGTTFWLQLWYLLCGLGLIFQQDNVTAHTARITRAFLNQSNINVLDWPSKSPDLSPIEHVWDELGRRVRNRRPQPKTRQELSVALATEWDNIPRNIIRKFTSSMRRRCQAVFNSRAGHTRYWSVNFRFDSCALKWIIKQSKRTITLFLHLK